MIGFALTIFTSAFLLFQIQPLIAKFILPWFGGGPAIWAVSMLFFQVMLVAGYAYAHLLVRFLAPRRQAIVHLVLLVIALTQLPVAPEQAGQVSGASDPTLQILYLLAVTIGVPFLVLSATVPLVQTWASRASNIRNPYRLYALSNTASLLALLSYPFVVEPLLTRQTQTVMWSVIFAGFVAACAYCAVTSGFRNQQEQATAPGETTEPIKLKAGTLLLWLALSATAVALLLGVTNRLTRDLASIPFLWVLPLGTYLLTYIISFDRDRWYQRRIFIPAMALCIAVLLFLLSGNVVAVPLAVCLYLLSLFVLCMVCHGELYRLRPQSGRFTAFYLMIALGGALGSAFVAVGMPVLSNDYLELQLGIGSLLVLTAVLLIRDKNVSGMTSRIIRFAAPVVVLLVAASLVQTTRESRADVLVKTRNFYGVLTVGRNRAGTDAEAVWLRNGSSYHGVQFSAPQLRSRPGAYYSPRSGVALTMSYRHGSERRIGMVGLGVGSIAAYATSEDYLRIYEIDPAVVELASSHFSFIEDSAASVDMVIGDARQSLANESPQAFDIFILDAFSSDAIPVHLLTHEAFSLYLDHLAEDGVIAVLISSWFFDFEPLLHQMADEFGLDSALLQNPGGQYEDWGSRWVIMTRNEDFMSHPQVQRARQESDRPRQSVRLWTDDYSSPFQLLKP